MREDRDLRKYTRRGALGLMGAGGVFAATETFGFTELTADRGVGVSVGGDADAGVKIVDSSDDTKITKDNFSDPAEIEFVNDTSTDINNIYCGLDGSGVDFNDTSSFTDGNLDDTLDSDGSSAILEINNTSNDGENSDGSSQNTTLSIEIEFAADTDPPVTIDLSRDITINA